MTGAAPPPVIFTVGHGTRPLEEFILLLKTHGVQKIADIRTVPRSRHNPQFNQDTLPHALAAVGLGYVHLPGLGGLRHPRRDSPNLGWHNDSFRGFADYMQTPEFAQNLSDLIKMARQERLALMCAETVPWRCHRSLIADALTIRGLQVQHILRLTNLREHRLTAFARVAGVQITYPEVEPG